MEAGDFISGERMYVRSGARGPVSGMLHSVFLLAFNLVVDIAYAWIDPRIDIAAEGK